MHIAGTRKINHQALNQALAMVLIVIMLCGCALTPNIDENRLLEDMVVTYINRHPKYVPAPFMKCDPLVGTAGFSLLLKQGFSEPYPDELNDVSGFSNWFRHQEWIGPKRAGGLVYKYNKVDSIIDLVFIYQVVGKPDMFIVRGTDLSIGQEGRIE
jgi:hypothetical protein